MTVVDTFIAVDWSARSGPSPAKPCKDAIWLSRARRNGGEPEARYVRTRQECFDILKREVLQAKAAGERVLVGFDFAFGYPAGTLKALGISGGWRHGLLPLLAGMIRDDANRNNRFAVADALNARMGQGPGPLWGHPPSHAYRHLGPTRPAYPFEAAGGVIAEYRHVDLDLRGMGLQPIWKICYTASVGGQSLMGLPYLHRFLTDDDIGGDIVVWPFDTHFTADPFADHPGVVAAIVEIWPGLMPIDPRYCSDVRDEGQVKTVSAFMRSVFRRGDAACHFRPAGLPAAEAVDTVVQEEGWIFGAGT